MSFIVSLTPTAEDNLRSTLHWIAERSPRGAETWYRRWLEVLEYLEKSANFCRLAPESQEHQEDIRQIIFKTRHGRPYRALFTIRDDQVFVLHIRGPGQDLVARGDINLPD